jgi:multidrug efflux pump subunit AcrA (membrane-fusion protein)
VKPGQKILLVLDSYKGQVFEAEVSKIIPIMNERSRSFTVEAIFTKKPEALYPYLTVEANIVIQTNEKALTIPRSFLVEDSFVLDANNEKKPVVVGLKDYNKAEILKGLSEGETILKPAK